MDETAKYPVCASKMVQKAVEKDKTARSKWRMSLSKGIGGRSDHTWGLLYAVKGQNLLGWRCWQLGRGVYEDVVIPDNV